MVVSVSFEELLRKLGQDATECMEDVQLFWKAITSHIDVETWTALAFQSASILKRGFGTVGFSNWTLLWLVAQRKK